MIQFTSSSSKLLAPKIFVNFDTRVNLFVRSSVLLLSVNITYAKNAICFLLRRTQISNTYGPLIYGMFSLVVIRPNGGNTHYYKVYSGEYLWQAIPCSMRAWWLDGIHKINIHGLYPYHIMWFSFFRQVSSLIVLRIFQGLNLIFSLVCWNGVWML